MIDVGGTIDLSTENAEGDTSGTTVPEFPLGIAIPAAISLGIIFFLFRRNQKK
ncbi:MAG: PEF-CTERM sorting domain-containing protein [Methanosarcinales archaeon]